MLKLSNIDTYYGPIQALRNVSLTVEQGEIVSLLGGNACGKSTTIRMLCGLLTPTSGSARVLGCQVPEDAEALRRSKEAGGAPACATKSPSAQPTAAVSGD